MSVHAHDYSHALKWSLKGFSAWSPGTPGCQLSQTHQDKRLGCLVYIIGSHMRFEYFLVHYISLSIYFKTSLTAFLSLFSAALRALFHVLLLSFAILLIIPNDFNKQQKKKKKKSGHIRLWQFIVKSVLKAF